MSDDVYPGTTVISTILKRYLGLVPGLLALAIYSSTACRSVWIGDSAEFALALKTFGICHPPGYPLFTITGRIFVEVLPFLRPILAAGLFNVVVAAAGVSIIYFIFRDYLGRWPSLFISLIWAFTPLFWEETSGVEIYALNLLLIALIFLVLESEKSWKWLMATYLFGLALTNHPSALSILPVLIFVFIRDKQYLNWRIFPAYIFMILLAGSIYLYLPIRSSLGPISNWGSPTAIRSLLDHMTLTQYSGWISYSWMNVAMSARLFFESLLESWWWIGILTTSSGLFIGIWIARTRTISAVLTLIFSVLLSSSHRAINYEPFYIPALFASLLLSGNIFILIEKRIRAPIMRNCFYSILPLACLILLFRNYQALDKSRYRLAEDYAKTMLDTADSGILFTAGDINSFPSLYMRYVENYRPQVEIYDRSIRLNALIDRAGKLSGRDVPDYPGAREIVIKQAVGKKYLAKNHYIYEPDWLKLSEPIYSYGILYVVDEKPDNFPAVPEYPSGYAPDDVLSRQLLVNLDLSRGEQLLYENPEDSSSALAAFNSAIERLDHESQAVVLNNVGIFFRGAGYRDLALKVYALALEKPLISAKDRKDIFCNISNVYKDKGNNFLASKDFHGAVASFEKALEYDQYNPDLLLNIGLIYSQMLHDPANARAYLKRYLGVKPSDSRVREYLNSLK